MKTEAQIVETVTTHLRQATLELAYWQAHNYGLGRGVELGWSVEEEEPMWDITRHLRQARQHAAVALGRRDGVLHLAYDLLGQSAAEAIVATTSETCEDRQQFLAGINKALDQAGAEFKLSAHHLI